MELMYGSKKYNVEIINDNGVFRVNDRNFELSVNRSGSGQFIISPNGYNINAYTALDKDRIYTCIDGVYFTFDRVSQSEQNYNLSSSAQTDIEILKPPMPGLVVKLLVSNDQTVEEGAPLIIIEAMKMETTLYSTITGIVKEINVSPGEQVDSDKVLMVVEAAKPSS